MPNLLGTAPNQVPTNGDLGKLAFMDVVDTVTNNPYLDTAISDTKPSLLLDFANSKTLDPRITYTRASTASYYDGKTTAMAEQNLLTYSQDFTQSAWTKSSGTNTANATTAPDGTNTASLWVPNTSAVAHYYGQNSNASANYTISFYAKAGGYSHAVVSNNVNQQVYFDLSAGTVESSLGTGWSSASIVNVGNGWYRCIATSSNAATAHYVYAYNAAQSNGNAAPMFAGDGTSGIYLWGAQLEQRSSVSSYTPTTSSPIANYIPVLQTAAAGVPRFDHDPVTGESKGFLIEEQRSNLFTYSSDFSNAIWGKAAGSVTADTIVAPDGTLTGDKFVNTAATAVHGFYQNYSSSRYVCSVYLKAAGKNYAQIYQASGEYANFDLINGVLGTVAGGTGTITSVGNGWYRCSFYGNSANTASAVITLDSTSGAYNGTSTGDGTSGLYIWGAQLEAGSFATSYIPTTTAQVTRSADAASITGANFSSWFRNSEGTFYGEGGVINNRLVCAYNTNSGARLADLYNNGTAFQFYSSNGSNFTFGTYSNNSKVAGAYSPSSYSAALNGAIGGTSIPTMPLTSVDTLGIGNYTGTAFANGTIKKLAYYPKRLSDAELQEMTL